MKEEEEARIASSSYEAVTVRFPRKQVDSCLFESNASSGAHERLELLNSKQLFV